MRSPFEDLDQNRITTTDDLPSDSETIARLVEESLKRTAAEAAAKLGAAIRPGHQH